MREMKDSGIEWIGKIPKEWGIVKFKYLHNGLNTGEAIDKEYWESDAGPNAFYTAGLTPIRTGYSNFPTWKETGENDLLLARNGTPYVYLPVSKAYYTDHIIRAAMSRHVNRRFIRYCLQQSIASIVVDSVSIPTWSATLWNNQILTWPSAIEQERIAAFLDAECAEIDTVLEKTRASIEEYKKLKQAVITQAVTKGIRGDRPMKDSGIEWIGDIPAEWGVVPHKRIMHKVKEICEQYNGEDIISLTVNGAVKRDLTAGGKMPTSFDGYQYVEPNDLLLCLFDIDVTPRCVGVVRDYGVTSPAYSRFVMHDGYYNAYYDYLLRMIDDNKVFVHLSKNLRSSLTESDFGAIKTCAPPLAEQKCIAAFLDVRCDEIDALIAKKQQYLTEIENYKKSLIYEYVTGKKEVV